MRPTVVRYSAVVVILFSLVALTPTTSAQGPVAARPPLQQTAGTAIVPWNWSLVPDGVGFGQSFRLLFVTAGERDATAKDIADYNTFVQDEAGAGHSAIRPHRAHFRVLGSTERVDARTNTGTHPENDGPGVPIYWLNGPKVADDYADFYDGAWSQADPGRSPNGSAVDFHELDYVYTGTKNDGTAAFAPLGGGKVDEALTTTVAQPGAKPEIDSGVAMDYQVPRRFYGLSGVFRVESVSPLTVGLQGELDGNLTQDDGGRDLFYFPGTAGVQYIIELKNTMVFTPIGPDYIGGDPSFVPGHLVDPSILEVVDSDGVQLLGEHDRGGFTANFARAFFTPTQDGVYYVAVGAGAQDRDVLGYYTLSVRRDDHADDYRTDSNVVLRPGQARTANIDSDVSSDDPGLNPWDWKPHLTLQGNSDGVMRPRRGIESLDDRDAFRFQIPRAGLYRITVSNGPPGVGVWVVWDRNGNLWSYPETAPVQSYVDGYDPGTYYVVIGTPYQSSGNIGIYTVSLAEEPPSDETRDCPPGVTTDCVLEVGQLKTGNIDSPQDLDAWRVTLEAGEPYVFDVRGAGDASGEDNGGTLQDPFLSLLDPSGATVATNNDVGEGNRNAGFPYTVPEDAGGTYFVVASAKSGTLAIPGTYTVSVEEGPN